MRHERCARRSRCGSAARAAHYDEQRKPVQPGPRKAQRLVGHRDIDAEPRPDDGHVGGKALAQARARRRRCAQLVQLSHGIPELAIVRPEAAIQTVLEPEHTESTGGRRCQQIKAERAFGTIEGVARRAGCLCAGRWWRWQWDGSTEREGIRARSWRAGAGPWSEFRGFTKL